MKSNNHLAFHLFKTNITTEDEIRFLQPQLNHFLLTDAWSFDLEDCDRVFRVWCNTYQKKQLIQLFKRNSVEFEELHYLPEEIRSYLQS